MLQGNPLLLIAAVLPMVSAPLAYAVGRRQPERALLLLAGSAFADFAVPVHTAVFLPGRTGAYVPVGTSLRDGIGAGGRRLPPCSMHGLPRCRLRWRRCSPYGISKGSKACRVYVFFTLLTMGAVFGLFLSDQLLTTIVFFEIMSLSSYPWVAHEETPKALRAAQTYLWIAIIGGLCLLIGMLLLPHELLAVRYSSSGMIAEGVAPSKLFLPAALMLVGFGAKAGAFPLHVWLPKAHPVAPAPASALLSGILLKAGVFGIVLLSAKFMREIFAWHALIFWLGVATMVIGAVLALLSVEMKRILACSSMSQIGFILLGRGVVRVAQGGRRHRHAGICSAYGQPLAV